MQERNPSRVTKSLFFVAIDLYFWFFVWNKWHQWRRADHFLTTAQQNQQVQLALLHEDIKQYLTPPLWEQVSNWIAGTTLAGLCLLISVIQFTLGGFWKRIILAGLWLLAAFMLLVFWFLRKSKHDIEGPAVPDPWHDIT
jgi:hypothetical protein